MNVLFVGYFVLLFFLNILVFSYLSLEFNWIIIFLTNLFFFVLFYLTDLLQGFLKTKGKINALNINTLRLILCAVVAIVFFSEKNVYLYNFFLLYFAHLFFSIFHNVRKIKNSITNVKICMCKIKNNYFCKGYILKPSND